MNKRHLQILTLISQYKKIEVKNLSELCNVSQVTIRKDLDELERKGLLKREHGFAMVNNEDDLNYRLTFNYEEKYLAAKKALAIINDHETIMIESGSSCAILALEIAKAHRDITIITNSCFIPRYLKDYKDTKVIVLGGEYQGKSEVNVGPLIKHNLKEFFVDKLFIGTDGIDEDMGLTGNDYERCEVVRMMKERAKHLYVLTDLSKYNKRSNFKQFALEDVDYLICEDNVPYSLQELAEKYNFKIL